MKKKNYVKIFCFPALMACCFIGGDAFADAFLNPSDNAYSLKKVFSRPSLQSSPIAQVWQTNPAGEEFKRAFLDRSAPETLAERHLKTLFHIMDAKDSATLVHTLEVQDATQNRQMIEEVLDEMWPIVEQAGNNVAFGMDKIDNDETKLNVAASVQAAAKIKDELVDWQVYLQTLDETARTDMELALLASFMEKKEALSDEIFEGYRRTAFPDKLLKTSEDIYLPETRQIQGLNEIDEVLWSLMINDIMDLSTGVDLLSNDDIVLPGRSVENRRRSASLLDRNKKTDQIREKDAALKKKAFFERFERLSKKQPAVTNN